MERRSRSLYRDPPSHGVVEAVAAVSNTPTIELPPLYDTVDPDALDALFRSGNGNGKIVFTYGDYEVTVYSNWEIELESDGE